MLRFNDANAVGVWRRKPDITASIAGGYDVGAEMHCSAAIDTIARRDGDINIRAISAVDEVAGLLCLTAAVVSTGGSNYIFVMLTTEKYARYKICCRHREVYSPLPVSSDGAAPHSDRQAIPLSEIAKRNKAGSAAE